MSVFVTKCADPAQATGARCGQGPNSRQAHRRRLIGFLLGSALLHAGLLEIHSTLVLPRLVPHAGGAPVIAARIVGHELRRARARPAAHTDRRPPYRQQRRQRLAEQSPRGRARVTRAAENRTTPAENHHVRAAGTGSSESANRSKTPTTNRAGNPAPRHLAAATADTTAIPTIQHTLPHRAARPTAQGAAVRTIVERAFRARFYYPYVARRNGWQGEIDLGLHISAEGQISDVHVVKSSGYEVLDNAALNSAHSIHVLPELVDLLYGQAVDVVLPVRYRLFNG